MPTVEKTTEALAWHQGYIAALADVRDWSDGDMHVQSENPYGD